jgi:hypothetical protein
VLKHYETSDVSGFWCWRNPMGEIVTEVDIVNHYIQEQKPEIAETEELMRQFASKITNMDNLDPEYNKIISENFGYLTSDNAPPPPPGRVIREGGPVTPPKSFNK